MAAKYIFITGGVVSSLGKGIISASLGKLLQARGFKVTIQKFDPYINIDPGTLNPYEHGTWAIMSVSRGSALRGRIPSPPDASIRLSSTGSAGETISAKPSRWCRISPMKSNAACCARMWPGRTWIS